MPVCMACVCVVSVKNEGACDIDISPKATLRSWISLTWSHDISLYATLSSRFSSVAPIRLARPRNNEHLQVYWHR